MSTATAVAPAPALATVVHLADLDLLRRELADPASRARLRKFGFDVDGLPRLEPLRARVAAGLEPRWIALYEKLRARYGRAVAAVRARVCLGCFVTLPTTARPPVGADAHLSVCESCGRIHYWG